MVEIAEAAVVTDVVARNGVVNRDSSHQRGLISGVGNVQIRLERAPESLDVRVPAVGRGPDEEEGEARDWTAASGDELVSPVQQLRRMDLEEGDMTAVDHGRAAHGHAIVCDWRLITDVAVVGEVVRPVHRGRIRLIGIVRVGLRMLGKPDERLQFHVDELLPARRGARFLRAYLVVVRELRVVGPESELAVPVVMQGGEIVPGQHGTVPHGADLCHERLLRPVAVVRRRIQQAANGTVIAGTGRGCVVGGEGASTDASLRQRRHPRRIADRPEARIVRQALIVFSGQDRFQGGSVRGSDQLQGRTVRKSDLDRSNARRHVELRDSALLAYADHARPPCTPACIRAVREGDAARRAPQVPCRNREAPVVRDRPVDHLAFEDARERPDGEGELWSPLRDDAVRLAVDGGRPVEILFRQLDRSGQLDLRPVHALDPDDLQAVPLAFPLDRVSPLRGAAHRNIEQRTARVDRRSAGPIVGLRFGVFG